MPPKKVKREVEVPQLGEVDAKTGKKKPQGPPPEEEIAPLDSEIKCERIYRDLKCVRGSGTRRAGGSRGGGGGARCSLAAS